MEFCEKSCNSFHQRRGGGCVNGSGPWYPVKELELGWEGADCKWKGNCTSRRQGLGVRHVVCRKGLSAA